jgi:formylmethanofuran dehydrogenase subunit E
MGMLAGEIFGLDLPQTDKRLLVIAETDGCTLDGISAATGCYVGRRTLRIEDYGKVAAAFIDTHTGSAIRIVPRADSRTQAAIYACANRNDWEAQVLGYQRIPSEDLFIIQSILLRTPLEKIISRPTAKAICLICGEEVNNEREVILNGQVACRACVGNPYYEPCDDYVEQLVHVESL